MKALKEKPVNKQAARPKTKKKPHFDFDKVYGALEGKIIEKPGCWDDLKLKKPNKK